MRYILLVIYGLTAAFSASGQELYSAAPGEVLLRLRPGAGKVAALGAQLSLRYPLLEASPVFVPEPRRRGKVASTAYVARWYRLRVDSREDPRQIAENFAALEQVEFAQPNYLRRPAQSARDSLYSAQWNLSEIGWRNDVQADPVVVAIVDSGVEYDHPDLAGQLWFNASEVGGIGGVDDDGNGYIDDVVGWDFSDAPGLPGLGDYKERDADPRDESGHGTHVAGIVAAVVGNGRGIAGVAPNARIMVLRAGFNLPGGGYLEDDDVAAAIVYAADNGAQVINMSWGDPRPAPIVRDAVRYAAAAGAVLVAAAGNEGEDAVFYPARLRETIAVGAAAPGGEVLAFSNYGPSVDLVAPGQGILSLFLGGGYGERSGTSMAAPHVAGMAALLLGRYPHWQSQEVRAALIARARDVFSPGWDAFSGAGLLDFSALSLDAPPLARIDSPEQDDVLGGEKAAVKLRLARVDEWQLTWGVGAEPQTWTVLAEGGAGAVGEVGWDVQGAVGGLYQLRLRARWQGLWLEDRVRVKIQQTALAIDDLRVSQALAEGRWVRVVEWSTSAETAGRLVLERAGVRAHEELVPAARTQRVLLPIDLAEGNYELKVRAEGGKLIGHWQSGGEIEVAAPSVAHWPLQVAGELPAGYLLPMMTDFNGDGAGEIVQMGYGGGQQYNAADYYQWATAGLQRVFNSLALYIPWNVQDGDGDGLAEMLAVDAQRVRLFEAPRAGAFPSRLAWEQRDVWGGEVGDLDGDGAPEYFLRSAKGGYFQVFERAADDEYEELAVLNPAGSSSGQLELGQRQVIGDLDGDGRGDLMAGDSGGGLFVFEAIADNRYREVWRQEGEGDARIVGGGVDLDGDGECEFVVARYFDDAFDIAARRWSIEVYGAIGRDEYALEWQAQVLGASLGGSGISYGDLNGDGSLEWTLVTAPDIYVFSSPAADQYEAVWHEYATATQRPFVGDLDGDGRAELAYNTAEQVRVVADRGQLGALYSPAALTAYALDQERAQLEWQRVAGAVAYRVYRDALLLGQTPDFSYIDGGLQEGEVYRYYVRAVAADGQEGARSVERTVVPEPAPAILAVTRITSTQLAVEFSAPMASVAHGAHLFRVAPDIGIANSAIGDRGMRRIVLGFAQVLPDSGIYTLHVENLRGASAALLDSLSRHFLFTLTPVKVAARLLEARALSADKVRLVFDKEIQAAGDLREFLQIDGGVELREISVNGAEVLLTLVGSAPLRPLGRAYNIAINGLLDIDGLAVVGTSRFLYAAPDLRAATAFPNPYHASRGDLTFGFLPPQAEIYIYDIQGHLLRVLAEQDGDGGITWAGDNSEGQMLAAGIYYYRIAAAGKSKVGTLAIVR
jgi:subtilisin family serine protease